jgi:cell division protein FtsL
MGKKYYKKDNIYVVGSNATKLERYYDTDTNNSNKDNTSVNRRPVSKKKVKRYKYKMKFALILGVTMTVCLVMIKTQFTVKDKSDRILSLENKLRALKTQNRLLKDSINDNMSLEQVYEVATTKLGMVSPNKDQVNKFNIEEKSYTQQYSDITQPIKQDNNDVNGIFGFILSKGR